MKKLITTIFMLVIILKIPSLACDKCLTYYLEQELYDSDYIMDSMLDENSRIENENDSPYFFYLMGRGNTLNEIILKLEEPCKADLH